VYSSLFHLGRQRPPSCIGPYILLRIFLSNVFSKTVRTPDNIAVVREAIERSPHRSARRHSVSLGLSEASVRRILHKEHSSGVETSNSARSLSVVRILSILYYCIHIFQGFVYKLLFYCCVTLKHSCWVL